MSTRTRHVCPLCGATVDQTEDGVFWSMPVNGKRHAYVYLEVHDRPLGGRCPADTTRVVAGIGRNA